MDFKKLREEQEKTQSQVAIAAGISLMGYQLIERGVTKTPNPETLKLIKEFLEEE